MEKINVFDVQVPDGRQIRCMSYNKVTYFDLDDIGKLLNADINGAIGIGRKVFGDSYVSKIIDSGLAFNPVRVNIL